MYIDNYCRKYGIGARLCVKLECKNPAGSAKDRAALSMIVDAENNGSLKPGGVIIEPTSGNTGIALSAIGKARGYRVILTMPDTMSLERRRLLSAYGAELFLTPGKEGMAGAVRKAEELHSQISGSVVVGQFDNPSNPMAHYLTTGPEIWRDTEGQLSALVAGIGTGGTLCGCARFLKEKNSDIKIVGFEPASSPLLTEGRAGAHKLQGIGANFVPKNFDRSLCDAVLCVSDEDAYGTAQAVAETEGLLVGVSGAACICAAKKLACECDLHEKLIVCILPDSGERYLSTTGYLTGDEA